jgi:hypothetical protein
LQEGRTDLGESSRAGREQLLGLGCPLRPAPLTFGGGFLRLGVLGRGLGSHLLNPFMELSLAPSKGSCEFRDPAGPEKQEDYDQDDE